MMYNDGNMSQAVIQLAYDGASLRSGTMDVRDLAPALLSIGQLCERANELLNSNQAEIEVRVRSDFQTGSFELSLDITQKLLELAKTLFSHREHLSTAKDLLESIGLLGGGGVSLIKLIKWLRGRKAEKTTILENGNIRIVIEGPTVSIGDNSGPVHIDVHPHIVTLYNDEDIRKATWGAIRPLENEGIDTFAVRANHQDIELITKADLDAFAPWIEPQKEELLLENERTAALTIVKPSFDHELKWVFAEGEARFSALMLDDYFLKRLHHRDITFGKGDILIVTLVSKSYRAASGVRTEHRIPKVLEIKAAPRQIALLPPPTDA